MKKYTNYDKRKLAYEGQKLPAASHLDLPEMYKTKISHIEHRRVKEAFFINAEADLTLTKNNFAVTLRSLGIVMKTAHIYQIFEESELERMSWQAFLQAYIALRNHKGSYK